MPALVYNPRLFPEGGIIRGNRQHMDLLPTVADVLNYDITNAQLPGQSLLAPLPPEGRDLYHTMRNPNKALVLRRGTKKFVYYYGRRPMEVYDVKADPLEKENIAGRSAPEHLRGIEREMLRWRRSVEQEYATAATQ